HCIIRLAVWYQKAVGQAIVLVVWFGCLGTRRARLRFGLSRGNMEEMSAGWSNSPLEGRIQIQQRAIRDSHLLGQHPQISLFSHELGTVALAVRGLYLKSILLRALGNSHNC